MALSSVLLKNITSEMFVLGLNHPWSNFTETGGLDRGNLCYLKLHISAVLRNLLMCTSSSDIISGANMLVLLEAVYITSQQCLNQDLFSGKGQDAKKLSNLAF